MITVVSSMILLQQEITNKQTLLLADHHHLLQSLLNSKADIKLRLPLLRRLDLPVLLTTPASIVRTTHQGPLAWLPRKRIEATTTIIITLLASFSRRRTASATRTTAAWYRAKVCLNSMTVPSVTRLAVKVATMHAEEQRHVKLRIQRLTLGKMNEIA